MKFDRYPNLENASLDPKNRSLQLEYGDRFQNVVRDGNLLRPKYSVCLLMK